MGSKLGYNSAILKDFRFWILLFFAVRLYGITFPPLDLSHNWRQTTVTMVARNFLETDANPLYPRVDIAGELSGITGMEFPLLNYLIYLVSLVFGYQHWYGRLIVLLFSSAGLWVFHKLCLKYFGKDIAFNAGIVLLFSIWFTYSRKIMPDTFSMSLVLFSLYSGLSFLENGKYKDLLLYFLFVSAGILSKLPSGYLLILFAVPFFSKSVRQRNKLLFALFSMTALIISYIWYYRWVPYLTETYGFSHFFMGKSLMLGASELATHPEETLSKFYDVAIKYIAFVFFIAGLYTAIRKKSKDILYVLIAGAIGFLPVMLKGGFTFYHHSYYIIPFVPVMALVSGFGISLIKNRNWVNIVLVAIAIEGILNHMDDFRIKPEYKSVPQLEVCLDRLGSRKDLIVINSGAFPTPVYFAHRKGWVAFNGELQTKSFTDSLRSRGLKYIVIMKEVFGVDVLLPYQEVYNDKHFRIYGFQ